MLVLRTLKTASVLFALATLWLAAFPADDAFAAYPDRIVRIVVPLTPGGGTDLIARTVAWPNASRLMTSGATGGGGPSALAGGCADATGRAIRVVARTTRADGHRRGDCEVCKRVCGRSGRTGNIARGGFAVSPMTNGAKPFSFAPSYH